MRNKAILPKEIAERLQHSECKHIPLCACGCGERVGWNRRRKGWNTYLRGHYARKMWENPDTRAAIEASIKQRWSDPKYRRKMRQIRSDDDYRRRLSTSIKEKWRNDSKYREKNLSRLRSESYRQKVSEWNKLRWKEREWAKKTKANMSKAQSDPELIERRVMASQSPEAKEKKRRSLEKMWADPDKSKNIRAALKQEEYRKKQADDTRARWRDDDYVKKMLSAIGRSPNNLERLFDAISPGKIRYTGDGSWWRRLPNGKYKNPDFKVMGEDKVIEIYGDYWHRKDDPLVVIEMFHRLGIECLVIYEHEIHEDLEGVLNRVSAFVDEPCWQMSLNI